MLNVLQQVQTYQISSLAVLQNECPFIATSNTQFSKFNEFSGNLGSSVTFDAPPVMTTTPNLVITTQGVVQQIYTLTVDQPASVAYTFTAEQFMFNVSDYIERIGRSAMISLGTQVESFVAGEILRNTYRFYGDGVAAINSFGQLIQALAFFKTYGSANGDFKAYIQDMAAPAIINSGLSQFALDRNDELAQSWMLGRYQNTDWYISNLLPLHTAGTVGQAQTTLTVVSVSVDGTQITCSGAALADADAVKLYDKGQFQDNVVGQTNIRYLTYNGQIPSASPVQFRITVNAPSDGAGQVVLNVFPALISNSATYGYNLSTAITAGMQIKLLPNHREGMICSNDPLYLAMPRLPATDPYPYSNAVDPDTGISIRNYWGTVFGQNQYTYVNDCIYGSKLVPQYAMALIFPES